MLAIENALKYTCAKDYQNRDWPDKVIAQIKWCSLFIHMDTSRIVSSGFDVK